MVARPIKPGRQTGTVFLYARARRHAAIQAHLGLVLEAFRPLRASPAFVQFGDVPAGHAVRRSFTLCAPDAASAGIVGLRYDREWFDVVAETPSDRRADVLAAVHITLKATAPMGRFRKSLVVQVDTRPPNACVVALYGNVTGDLVASPASLLFMGIEPGKAYSRRVTLRSRSEAAFQILSLRSNLAQLDIGHHCRPDGTVVITAKLDGGDRAVNAAGILVVETNHAQQSLLRIPVCIYYRRGQAAQ